MTCPSCGKRIGKLIIWSLALFFVSAFYAAKLLPPFFKSSKSEDRPFVARHVPLTALGQPVKDTHPKWDNSVCNLVGEGKISLHMNKEMVRTVWGEPKRVRISKNSEEVFPKETWILSGDRVATFGLLGVESFEEPYSYPATYR